MAKTVQHYMYPNETFSGCDMIATINISNKTYNSSTGKYEQKNYNKTLAEIQTVSYSIYMDKSPVRAIGNVNAKDYVVGQRTIAGSLVFSMFNKHFSQDIMENINADFKAGTAYLVDELPPFDLIISAANEYGYRSRAVIYGIRLLNEGQVMSINDIYTENTYQFYATDIEYFTDELEYTKNKNGRGYILSDDIGFGTSVNYSHIFTTMSLDEYIEEQIQAHNEAIRNKELMLHYGIKQPSSENDYSLVNFYFEPGVSQGNIYIKQLDGENEYVIPLNTVTPSNQYNTINHAEISLPIGRFEAYVTDGTRKSNTVNITVKIFGTVFKEQSPQPIVEEITSSSINVKSNAKGHNMLQIIRQDGMITEHPLPADYIVIGNLSKSTYYTLKTFNSNEREYSKSIQIKTLDNDGEMFERLKLYLKSNKRNLDIDNINLFCQIIEESKNLSSNPVTAIAKLYDKYYNSMKSLDIYDADYRNKKDKLEEKIEACQKIYDAAMKLFNDNTKAINKNNNVPAPEMFLDNNLNNVFHFDKNITSAEIYRVYKNIEQFDSLIYSYDFKSIKGKSNCYRFIGKPGRQYYIIALNGQYCSSRFYFTVMTNNEKLYYKNNRNKEMDDDNISRIKDTVENDLGNNISELNKQRAFLCNAKKITSPVIMPPSILQVKEDVLMISSIYDFYGGYNSTMNFYLAVSSYENAIKNNDIYKIPFTNRDKTINISYLYNGLENNKAYVSWIETEDGRQLSNPVTFIYLDNKADEYINDDINLYEIKNILDSLSQISKNDLDANLYGDLINEIESIASINSSDIIPGIIDALNNSVINKKSLIDYIYDIKYFLGTFTDSESSFINDVRIDNSVLKFTSAKKGSLVIYSGDEIISMDLKNDNSVALNDFNNIVVAVAVDDSLCCKSDIIIINRKEDYMEVV